MWQKRKLAEEKEKTTSENLRESEMFWTDQVQIEQCSRKVVSGRRVAGVTMSLNFRDLQLECARVLHETLLAPIQCLMYGNETMFWKEEISRIMAVQTNNLRGLLGIRMMDRVLNE